MIKVKNKYNGVTAIMRRKDMELSDKWEELTETPKEPSNDMSYSAMKEVAKEKGLEFKGNIKKAELEELIK